MSPRALAIAAFKVAPFVIPGVVVLLAAWWARRRRCPVEGCRERCGHWRAP